MVFVETFHVLVRVGRVARFIGTIGTLVARLLPVAGADYVTFQVNFRRVIVRTVQTLIRFHVPRAVAVPLVVVSWNRLERSCFFREYLRKTFNVLFAVRSLTTRYSLPGE